MSDSTETRARQQPSKILSRLECRRAKPSNPCIVGPEEAIQALSIPQKMLFLEPITATFPPCSPENTGQPPCKCHPFCVPSHTRLESFLALRSSRWRVTLSDVSHTEMLTCGCPWQKGKSSEAQGLKITSSWKAMDLTDLRSKRS